MSHELRTPLNSLLILSRQLADNRREQPHRQAGPVRADHPPVGRRPAGADQRDPRPRQDRVGHDGASSSTRCASTACATTSSAPSGRSPRRRACGSRSSSIQRCRRRIGPTTCGCGRCCATCSRTRSSSPTKGACPCRYPWWRIVGVCRTQLQRGRAGAGVRRQRHRHRHPEGEAADHLRGLPAGRRRHQPQVRRHRPGALPISREIASLLGGELLVDERARRGQHLHALPAASRFAPRRRSERTALAPTRHAAQRRAIWRSARARPPRAASAGSSGRAVCRPWPTTAALIQPGDRVLLIVEDDETFAQTLLDLARERGFRGVVRRYRRRGAGARRTASSPTPSPSTCGCPTWTAGCCSIVSSTTPRRATSRYTSSLPPAAARSAAASSCGAVAVLTQAGRAGGAGVDACSRCRSSSTAASSGCWWSRTTRPSARRSSS